MGELKAGAAAPCTASFSGGNAADHSSDALPALLTVKPSSTPGKQCQGPSAEDPACSPFSIREQMHCMAKRYGRPAAIRLQSKSPLARKRISIRSLAFKP